MPRCLNPNCRDKFNAKYFLQKHCMEKDECIRMELEMKKATIWKEKRKEWVEKLKTLSDYEQEAREPFQKWIRLVRDVDQPCISCDNSDTDKWDAGHYFKAELYSGLIFDERNVHKQCKQCNHRLHGNESGYRIGLVKRYGEAYVLELEKIKDVCRNYKYTKLELIEIKNIYKLKLKQLL